MEGGEGMHAHRRFQSHSLNRQRCRIRLEVRRYIRGNRTLEDVVGAVEAAVHLDEEERDRWKPVKNQSLHRFLGDVVGMAEVLNELYDNVLILLLYNLLVECFCHMASRKT